METEEDSKVHPSSHPQPPPPQRPTSPQPARSGTVAEPSKDLLKMERIDDDARKQKMYQSFLIKEHKTERVKPSPRKINTSNTTITTLTYLFVVSQYWTE